MDRISGVLYSCVDVSEVPRQQEGLLLYEYHSLFLFCLMSKIWKVKQSVYEAGKEKITD
jgi:hypothetical protein